jgi:hypothetical protein
MERVKRQGFVTCKRPPKRMVEELSRDVDSMRVIAGSFAGRSLTPFERWMVDHLSRLNFEVNQIKKKLRMPNY